MAESQNRREDGPDPLSGLTDDELWTLMPTAALKKGARYAMLPEELHEFAAAARRHNHGDWTDDATVLSGLADRLEQESADESERGNDSTACAWSCRAYELRQIVSRMVRSTHGVQTPAKDQA